MPPRPILSRILYFPTFCPTITEPVLCGRNRSLPSPSDRALDGQIVAIAPFFPRTGVVPHVFETRQFQRDICVRGAVAALAVGDDFPIGCDAKSFVHRTKLSDRFVTAVFVEVLFPFKVNGAGDGTTALCAHRIAEVLGV